MRISHIWAALACLPLLALPARATGGLGCSIDDANLKLTADTAVSRGMGGQFINFTASAEILAKEAPEDMRKLTLDKALIHHWYTGREIKLSFYSERNDNNFASIDIAIETTLPEGAEEDADFQGTYDLSIFAAPQGGGDAAATVYTGKATCLAGG
ncbi:MAG: hypothetical protein HC855_03880 [Rhizobiales bacterium]|nr:hypothetical protein [Hyphomicrobiales bacterium]